LYDPLLRRFLNADENIQDPYNTQNYNKYGYVLNNPLMFNDPSREFVWAAGFFLTYVAPIIWGAVVGTLISVGMYTIQSLVMNNWSWNGFANSLLMGAVTGGVSGGLGQVFSASGFWGTVGNGTLAGAGSGGVTALLTGQNFLEGVLKGAVISAAVTGITWTLNKFYNSYEYQINEMLVDDNNTLNGTTKAEFNLDTVKKVADSRYKNQFIRGSWHLVDETSDPSSNLREKGYSFGSSKDLLVNGDGKEVWGLTERVLNKGRTVWQRIYLPKGAFISLEQLDLTIGHETLHSILNNARIFDVISTANAMNQKQSLHEFYTSRWEEKYIQFRKWGSLKLSVEAFNTGILFDKSLDSIRNKIAPIFNNYLKSTLK